MKLNKAVVDCLEKYDNFYLYDEHIIAANLERLKINFPQVDFLYSIKCNANFNVLCSIFSRGFGADAASVGEVRLAQEAGLSAKEIYYSAPGKSLEEIKNAVGQAVLIADSLGEIQRIQTVAEQVKTVVNIGIRINPNFTFSGIGGQSSKFGVDEEQAISFLKANPYKNIKVTGIHVHLKSQELNADTLAVYYKRIFNLAKKVEQICGTLEYINMGSGMGIPYAPADRPLDVAKLGLTLKKEIDRYRNTHPYTKIIIEVGRYAVGESGIYVTRVLDRKISHGKTYLILKNTLNGFIRPSLARLIAHYSTEDSPMGTEPLFTSKDAFGILTLKENVPLETVTLVGNLCTSADVIAEDICLPHLESGDAVILTNAGSYAAVLSPMQFSAQEKPKELFLLQSGEVRKGKELFLLQSDEVRKATRKNNRRP